MFAATAFSGVLPVGVRASNGSRARVRARATVAAPAGSRFGSFAGMRRTSAVDVIGASTYRGKTRKPARVQQQQRAVRRAYRHNEGDNQRARPTDPVCLLVLRMFACTLYRLYYRNLQYWTIDCCESLNGHKRTRSEKPARRTLTPVADAHTEQRRVHELHPLGAG